MTRTSVNGSVPTMIETLVPFAHRLADAARRETLERWATGCDAINKAGSGEFDPVTDADREAERAMSRLIEANYSDHGISGEEFGEKPGAGSFSWSLDPVDGTRSFTCGLPTWVTLIALLDQGRPVLGLIDVPCLNERYLAWNGKGFFARGGKELPLASSDCVDLSEARLSTTDPYLFEGPHRAAFERVREKVRTTRYGHDGYAYARLAAGSLDLVIESGLKPHDYNALIPVVRAAGGVIADWAGGDDFVDGRVIAAATPELFDQAAEMMNGG